MVASRADCPDPLAAALLGQLPAAGRRALAWSRLLVRRAGGLAGKPLTIAAVLEACTRLNVLEPPELVRVLTPGQQDLFLWDALAVARSPEEVLAAVSGLPGTDVQAAAVRSWLARWGRRWGGRWTSLGALATGEVQLSFWCAPRPLSDAASVWEVEQAVTAMAPHCPDRGRLAVVFPAVLFRPRLLDLFAENPVVDREWLLTQLAALPAAALRDLEVDLSEFGRDLLGELFGEPARSPQDVDVLRVPPAGSVGRVAELAVVLEPLLGTAAWSVLDELFGEWGEFPLAQLIATAAAATDTAVPPAVRDAADRLPAVG